jgi:hypothetical protein
MPNLRIASEIADQDDLVDAACHARESVDWVGRR